MSMRQPRRVSAASASIVALLLTGTAVAQDGGLGNTSSCTDRYLPIDGQLLGNSFPTNGCATECGNGNPDQSCHNYGFTTEVHALFTWTSYSDVFTVTGDDDVWVFVNNYLAVDLGGVHLPANETVLLNQATGAAFNGMVLGGDYALDIFHAERYTKGSQLKFATNIGTLTGSSVSPGGCSVPDPAPGDSPITPGLPVQCVPYDHAGAPISLTATVRDFASAGSGLVGSNPDFQACVGTESGIVAMQLGADQKPVYDPKHGYLDASVINNCGGALSQNRTTHGPESFQEWYHRPYQPEWESIIFLQLIYRSNYTDTGLGITNGPAYVFSNSNSVCTDGCPTQNGEAPPPSVLAPPPSVPAPPPSSTWCVSQVPCGPGDPGASCATNPCTDATCNGYPNARCIPNYCSDRLRFLGITTGGACTPVFVDPASGQGVHCASDAPFIPGHVSIYLPTPSPQPSTPLPPSPPLSSVSPPPSPTNVVYDASELNIPGRVPPSMPALLPLLQLPNQVDCGPHDPGVRCLRDPCAGATCGGHPAAVCIPNYCIAPRVFLGVMTGPPCSHIFADPLTQQGVLCATAAIPAPDTEAGVLG